MTVLEAIAIGVSLGIIISGINFFISLYFSRKSRKAEEEHYKKIYKE
jgi:hypothetical protein